ncbi:phosphatases II [Aaosphaeria arxii CBS 175.79]|uniref:Phosphatases II n=1 Tax=Aaosphaeria arxii CBS 175.79 TaxID=1450172 RepID=A0A6A5XCI9_9PLEO|nr:phosphatases II [Aaosphaeria arxii CBS 175.79]KAF2010629.1 phosphatases II [Aaosphaeria arxii CBS 175.79]
MNYLLHGSTSHTGMGWVDLVPRAGGNLYIGGLYALYQTDLMSRAGITHVLSVIDYAAVLPSRTVSSGGEEEAPKNPFPASMLAGRGEEDKDGRDGSGKREGGEGKVNHLHIDVEDHPNVDMLQHFPTTCAFIEEGLRSPSGGVFVHCAMGKSRSAAVVVAYLMRRFGVGVQEGLDWLCEGRPVCEPNLGFREQLGVWGEMCRVGGGTDGTDGGEGEGERRRIYERWKGSRFVGEVWEWEGREERKKIKASLCVSVFDTVVFELSGSKPYGGAGVDRPGIHLRTDGADTAKGSMSLIEVLAITTENLRRTKTAYIQSSNWHLALR